MNWIREIKWAYQRVVRGYDDRIAWDFSYYLTNIIIPPLKEYCLSEVDDANNPERAEVLRNTLIMIEHLEVEDWTLEEYDQALNNFWTYFGQHIGWYWN